jgi:hypothetical protein
MVSQLETVKTQNVMQLNELEVCRMMVSVRSADVWPKARPSGAGRRVNGCGRERDATAFQPAAAAFSA